MINVISAYPHKSSLFCSYPFYRMIFSMEEDSSSNGCVRGSGLNFIENWSPEDWRPLDSLLSCKLRHPSHEIFYWFVSFILFFYFWFYVISDVVISSSILNNWILLKAGTYYNVAGWILLLPYKQPTVASKHSTEKALVSTLPKIYCLYSVYGGLSAGNPLFWELCQQWAEPIFIR